MGGLAEERSEIGGQRVEQGDQLPTGCVGHHVLVVGLEGAEFALADLLAEASLHQLLLPAMQVDAASAIGKLGDLIEFAGREELTAGLDFQIAPPYPESTPPGRRPKSSRR